MGAARLPVLHVVVSQVGERELLRGEQVADITAAGAVMREKATTITAGNATMDIVGTGGDGFGTYNI